MIKALLGKLRFVMLSHVNNSLLDMIRLLGVSRIEIHVKFEKY